MGNISHSRLDNLEMPLKDLRSH